MTDLLEAASSALGTPRDLVQRSAAARAAANGVSVDDILAAWAGDAPPPAPTAATPEPEPQSTEGEPAPEPEPALEPAASVAVLEKPVVALPPPTEQTPVETLQPVPMGTRVKTAVGLEPGPEPHSGSSVSWWPALSGRQTRRRSLSPVRWYRSPRAVW